MTTGEIIVVALFGVGVICSLTLLFIIRRHVRRERDSSEK